MTKAFNYGLLNLESRDIRIYESLLDHEEVASIRNVSSWTGINRGVVFNSMNKLLELGLIGAYIRGKQKRYYANDPSALKQLLNNNIDELNVEKRSIESYVAHLKAKGKHPISTQFATLYEGEEEIATLLKDVLTTVSLQEDKAYSIISAAEIRGYLYKKFDNFTRQRIAKDIFVRVLSAGQPGEPATLSEIKILPNTHIQAPACYIIIYGNKVAQISLNDNLVPYGIVTNNPEVATLQKLVFDQLWQHLPAID
jgi:sugar-specific transcriptional regulator TrmB